MAVISICEGGGLFLFLARGGGWLNLTGSRIHSPPWSSGGTLLDGAACLGAIATGWLTVCMVMVRQSTQRWQVSMVDSHFACVMRL